MRTGATGAGRNAAVARARSRSQGPPSRRWEERSWQEFSLFDRSSEGPLGTGPIPYSQE